MAKKNIKKKDEVAKCDQFEITNCDDLDHAPQFELQKMHLEKIDITSLIRVIRGQKVILDFDLAMLYGVKTKYLNQSVKRNIDRFPDDFMFQLTKIEWNLLRSQIATRYKFEVTICDLKRTRWHKICTLCLYQQWCWNAE